MLPAQRQTTGSEFTVDQVRRRESFRQTDPTPCLTTGTTGVFSETIRDSHRRRRFGFAAHHNFKQPGQPLRFNTIQHLPDGDHFFKPSLLTRGGVNLRQAKSFDRAAVLSGSERIIVLDEHVF